MTQKQIDTLDFITFACVFTLAIYFLSSAVLPAEPVRLDHKPEVYSLQYREGDENRIFTLEYYEEASK